MLKQCDWNLRKTIKCVAVCCILHNIAEENKEVFHEGWLRRVEEFDLRFPPPHQNVINHQNAIRAQGNQKRYEIAQNLF